MSREQNDWYKKIDERLDKVDQKLAVVDANLGEHMRRTELAEKNHEMLRRDFEPVKIHVAVVGALGKIIAVIGALVAIGVGIKNLWG